MSHICDWLKGTKWSWSFLKHALRAQGGSIPRPVNLNSMLALGHYLATRLMAISTRRVSALPSALLFPAIGLFSPNPRA